MTNSTDLTITLDDLLDHTDLQSVVETLAQLCEVRADIMRGVSRNSNLVKRWSHYANRLTALANEANPRVIRPKGKKPRPKGHTVVQSRPR